jgi:hypothetical protein
MQTPTLGRIVIVNDGAAHAAIVTNVYGLVDDVDDAGNRTVCHLINATVFPASTKPEVRVGVPLFDDPARALAFQQRNRKGWVTPAVATWPPRT